MVMEGAPIVVVSDPVVMASVLIVMAGAPMGE